MFDLDGTLVQSEHVAAAAFTIAYERCVANGAPPTRAFLAQSGRPFEDICRDMGLPSEMTGIFRAESAARMTEVRIFPGIRNMLYALGCRGIALALFTGKDRPRTLALLEHLQLLEFFAAVITPDDPFPPKPSPEAIHALCTSRPGMSLVTIVGDSTTDMLTARLAGVGGVGVSWGVSDVARLREAGAEFVADSVPRLWRHLTRYALGGRIDTNAALTLRRP